MTRAHRIHALAIVAVAMLVVSGSGCAPPQHTPDAYRSPAAAADVERDAAAVCRAMGEPLGPPSRPFVTDGCSLWLDGSWVQCCVEHDKAYWCGGSSGQRGEADRVLRRCVAQHHSDWLGGLMYAGVRVGGHPWGPGYWRWGYGHPYPAGYNPSP